MHRRWYALFVTVVTLLLVGGISPAALAAEDGDLDYVALGDSYAAGPLIPFQHGEPVGCFRSTRNYPAMLADRLDVDSFTDVTCSGATTEDMTAAQDVFLGPNPPQFAALEPGTDLVTITIGGNDLGFAEIVTTCAKLSVTAPFGAPCKRHTADDYPQRIEPVAREVGEVLEGIHQRSPGATVVLVGYLKILPDQGGCFPVVPIARGDVAYLDGLQEEFTAALAEQADEHGALLVNAYAHSQGHDICQPPAQKWVEGFIPTRPAFPVHPNAAGMRAVTRLIVHRLAAVT